MEPKRSAFTKPEPVSITLPLRFMLPDMSEHACRATQLSADGAIFLTSVRVAPGEPIVCYAEGMGRVEGVTGEMIPAGLKVAFNVTGLRREKLEEALRLLAASGQSNAQRRHERFVPQNANARVTLPNGREHACEIIDISLSGAALRITVKPELGSHLLLGKTRGRVVRHLTDGIAVEFVKQIEQAQLKNTLE